MTDTVQRGVLYYCQSPSTVNPYLPPLLDQHNEGDERSRREGHEQRSEQTDVWEPESLRDTSGQSKGTRVKLSVPT